MKRAIVSIVLGMVLAGCGGGSGQSARSVVPVQVSISLVPSSQQRIDAGQYVNFTASVANDSDNQGVSWSLTGTGCSGAACGTLTNLTSTAAKYHAPANVSGALNVSVTARAVKDANAAKTTPVAVAPAPAITTTSLPSGLPGNAYAANLQATGGTGSLSWSLASGSLPDGLGLDTGSGAISGTPAGGGTWNFTARVTDSAPTPLSAEQPLTITIETQSMVVRTTSLPDGTQGVAYNATLKVSYAVLPVAWSVTSGALPAGLALAPSTGLISGTPTTAGTSNFTVTVTDSSVPARSASQPLSITISLGGAANALLRGRYAFLLSGYDSAGSPVAMAGSFSADGAGGLGKGVQDLNSFASGAAANLAFSGTYAVGADRRGTLTFTNSRSQTFTLAMALDTVSSDVATKGSLLEFDVSGYNLSGVIELQDSGAFLESALNGSYVFSFTGTDAAAHRLGVVGQFAADGAGGLREGLFDANDGGALTSRGSFTGAYTAPGLATGRGIATLAGAMPAAEDYAFYVVSASRWLALSMNDPAAAGLTSGPVVAQSPGPFALDALNATSVLSLASRSDSAGSRVSLGLAVFDGNGNFSSSLDVNDASALATLTAEGIYSVESSGRLTLTPQSGSELIGYLIQPNRAFILGAGEEVPVGRLEAQSPGPFSDSTLDATLFFGSEPFAAPPTPPPLGGFTASLSIGNWGFDSNGNLTGTMDLNQLGELQADDTIQDTYAISSDGRVTVGSGSMILYIISPGRVASMNTRPKDPNPVLGSAQP